MCDDSRYSSARDMINNEWVRLTEAKNYVMLNGNAQEFIKIIKEEKENGSFDILTFPDKKKLNLFNQYVRETKLHHAKRIFIEQQVLLEKPAAQNWLTSEAKIYYDAWKRTN